MSQGSILSRVLASFLGNVLRAGLSFITGMLLARGMGPTDYGVFAFLLASFTALTQLLDMGSSNAFLTFISKRTPARTHFFYYGIWQCIQFLLLLAFIAVLAPSSLIDSIWQGENRERVLIAFVAVFLQQRVWLTISQIGESQRFTAQLQVVSVLIAVVHLVLVLVLMSIGKLEIEILYGIIALEFLLGCILAYLWFPLVFDAKSDHFPTLFKDYRRYCLPLIPMNFVAVFSVFADTWLLQKFGGSTEQAYYAVAAQFSIISLIATRSILNILWKEVAEAYAQEKLDVVIRLFERSARYLHHLGAFISGILIPWTPQIILIVLGPEYVGGALAMAIMFLYPVDQARGQVAGTMLLAMEKTKITLIMAIGSNLVGLTVAYLMMAPGDDAFLPGLELGAVGLALKMVGVQFLTVNVSLYIICRLLGAPMNWSYQFVGLMVFLILGFGSHQLTLWLLPEHISLILQLVMGGGVYVIFSLLVLLLLPGLLGLTKQQITHTYTFILQKLPGKRA